MSFRAFLLWAEVNVQRPSTQHYIFLEQSFPMRMESRANFRFCQQWTSPKHTGAGFVSLSDVQRLMDYGYCVDRKTSQRAETVCLIAILTIKFSHLVLGVLVIQRVTPGHSMPALHMGTMEFVEV